MLENDPRSRAHLTSALVTAEGSTDLSVAQPGIYPLDEPGDGTVRRQETVQKWRGRAFTADGAALALAAAATHFTLGRGPWMVGFFVLVIALLFKQGAYRYPLHLRLLDYLWGVVVATSVSAALLISIQAVTDPTSQRAPGVRDWLLATMFLASARTLLVMNERHARKTAGDGCRTLIIGAGVLGNTIATRLQEHPEIGLRPIGFLDKSPLKTEGECAVPVLGASWDLERVVTENNVEHAVFSFSTAPTEVLLDLARRCDQLGVRTSFVPRLFERTSERMSVDSLGGIPLVTKESQHPKSWQFTIKHAIDRVLAMLALAVLAPIMAASAVAVLVSLGRPIFYRAERVSRDGETFGMLKFRTMRGRPETDPTKLDINSEIGTSGVRESDRLTPMGALMRRSSLDELPQLFNVLRGDMSLVGPRPERTEYVEVLEKTVHRYKERDRVKAGITGWAQVHGLRGDTSLADRVEWDNYYIENWSLWLDFRIMLMTFAAVLRINEAN